MAFVFEIPDEARALAEGAISDMINQMGKDCVLYMPPKLEDCVNCFSTKIQLASGSPSNAWLTGSPGSLQSFTCPDCGGVGKKAVSSTETIKLLVSNDPSEFETKMKVNIPKGMIETKGFITDLEKVLLCQEMVLQPTLSTIKTYRYQLYGEPIDQGNIVQGVFFVCLWKRA